MTTFSYTVVIRHGLEQAPMPSPAPPVLLARLARAGIPRDALERTGETLVRLHLTGQDWDGVNLGALVAAALARPTARIDGGPPASAWVEGSALAGTLRLRLPHRPDTVLLDRDGTIIEDRHYLSDPEEVRLLPGAADGLRRLARAGIRLVVVSNQSGVSRGMITAGQLAAVNQRMTDLLQAEEVTLAGIWTCPHAPDDGCTCRKPAEGLAIQAANELGFDLTGSVVVGDKASDLGLARRLGVPGFLVGTGDGPVTLRGNGHLADFVVEDLPGVAQICCHPAGVGPLE